MKIEFSLSQPPAPRASVPANGSAPSSQTAATPALQGMADLQRKLNNLALTRPEKMDAAQAQIANVKYPPEQLLNGIAHLLAINFSS